MKGKLWGNCCKFEELQVLISTNKLIRTYSINSYDWFEGERHTHQFSANRTVVHKKLFYYAPWESCFTCSSNKVVVCAGLHPAEIYLLYLPANVTLEADARYILVRYSAKVLKKHFIFLTVITGLERYFSFMYYVIKVWRLAV